MPSLTQKEQAGWDAKYLEQSEGAAWSDVPQPLVPEFLNRLPAGSRIADLGAGDGRNAAVAVERGHHVVMLDISPTALALALRRFKDHEPPRPFAVVASMEEMPLASEQFDALIVLDALSQVKNCEQAVREMHRILNPGGLCLVNVFTRKDAAWGQGERVGPRSFSYKNCLFNFFEDDDVPELCGGLFNIVEQHHLRWVDPPHTPFRPYEHEHDALFYVLQKP